MKQKLLLILFTVTCLSFSVSAQISKGSTWLGGNIGFSRLGINVDPATELKNNGYSVSAGIGKAIKENTILGIQLGYDYSKVNYAGSNITSDAFTFYDARIFLRQYVPVMDRLYFYGEGYAGFGINRYKVNYVYNNVQVDEKSWSTTLSLAPGVSFAATKKLQLEAGFTSLFKVVYSKTKSTTTEHPYKTKIEDFSAGINLQDGLGPYIGFRILLAK